MRPAQLLAFITVLLGAPSARSSEWLVYFGTRLAESGAGISLARFDSETGNLSQPQRVFETPAPVFFAVSPDARRLYVCHGVDTFAGRPGSGVSAFAIDGMDGHLTLLNQQSTVGNGGSHVSLDRSGRVLLEANYRAGNVVAFPIEADGRIGVVGALMQHTGHSVHPQRQTAPHPHAIYADPTNQYALVPDLGVDRIFVYRLDPLTGGLAPRDPPGLAMPPGSGPRHLAWNPNGRYAYVVNELSNSVTVLAWDATRGVLTPRTTVPTLAAGFAGENTAAEIAVHPGGRFLYVSNRGAENSLTVFALDASGEHPTVVERVPSRGLWPRNFVIDPAGRWMIVSNHDSDNAVVFRIDQQTGRLSPVGEPVTLRVPFGIALVPTNG